MFGSRTNARPRVTRSHAVSQPVQALEQRVVLSGGMLGGMAKSVNSQAAAQVATTIQVKWPTPAQQTQLGENRAQLATDPRTATFRPEHGVRETIPQADLGTSVDTEDFGLLPDNSKPLQNATSSKPDSGRFGTVGTAGHDEQAFLDGLRGSVSRNAHRPGGDAANYAGSISTDPAQMLASAKGSLTSDMVFDEEGNCTETTTSEDGTTTTVTVYSPDGTVESRTTTQTLADGTTVRTFEGMTREGFTFGLSVDQPNGRHIETTWILRDGGWERRQYIRDPQPTRLPPPDGGEGGGGSGWLPGREPAKPWQRDPSPGIRPDESATAPSGPQLDVKVNLTGQPNPTEGAYSGSPVYTGYKPSDYVNPSRG